MDMQAAHVCQICRDNRSACLKQLNPYVALGTLASKFLLFIVVSCVFIFPLLLWHVMFSNTFKGRTNVGLANFNF